MGSSDALKCLLHLTKCCDLFINVSESRGARIPLKSEKSHFSPFLEAAPVKVTRPLMKVLDGEKQLKLRSFSRLKAAMRSYPAISI